MEQPDQNVTANPQLTETANPPLAKTATEGQALPKPADQRPVPAPG